jgi:hypothetical protein
VDNFGVLTFPRIVVTRHQRLFSIVVPYMHPEAANSVPILAALSWRRSASIYEPASWVC